MLHHPQSTDHESPSDGQRPAAPVDALSASALELLMKPLPRRQPSRQDSGSWRVRNSGSSVSMTEGVGEGFYRPGTLLWLSAFLFLLVPLLTLADVPIARYVANTRWSSDFQSALDLTLVFSHGIGVFLVLVGIMLMAPGKRWQVPRLATLALGGGSVAMMAKLFVLRPKPHALNLDLATTDYAWLWAFDWDLDQIATFAAQTRAFPSGKVATATALIVGLWVILPRGRWLFFIIGAGQLLQPLLSGAHFFTDGIGGVAFGLLWGYVCFSPNLLGSVFDRFAPESHQRLRRRKRGSYALAGEGSGGGVRSGDSENAESQKEKRAA
ncbi:phosphatase PAP2 family protein [Crateriforma conspicua]|uniref:PAP2 superfamily protein n=1 Tax=Crateriforma conspicua TaxID=2527996 RepID=A0A5C5Y5G9_9PLAN|nr:phosphatase PAP2 family protein [Crateriforma conspicua]QDV64566.1 PAP2 superfamily protein [Crateriforma conspicua]TWT69963.1 PAP2 superfamily protein [Crateriforma conspicua]